MKKLILVSAIAMSGLFYNTANAQIRVHLGINLWPHRVIVSSPVVVADAPVYQDATPAYDNDSNDDYYYLPNVGAYYNVAAQCYYYFDGDNWISAAYLPGYNNFDWRSARRFEVHAPQPYLHNDFYMQKYRGNNGNWAHNDGSFNKSTVNYGNAYSQPSRNDNRENHGNNYAQPSNQNHNSGNNGGQQQRFAQNNRGYNGHNNGKDRF
jgi:hypothetical protein